MSLQFLIKMVHRLINCNGIQCTHLSYYLQLADKRAYTLTYNFRAKKSEAKNPLIAKELILANERFWVDTVRLLGTLLLKKN